MKNRILAVVIAVLMILSTAVAGSCADVTNEKVYNPLDLIVVVDSSGSMNDSDPSRTAPDAIRMLVNMMPAEDSRVGIVGFNSQPTVLTRNASGNPALIPLVDLNGIESIRNDISSIAYKGRTGIGNALYAATELMKNSSDNDHTKAIILFTDGVNDFGNNQLALSECEQNEVEAVRWAKENDCYIYCVGYDFVENGVRSMGPNGEGLNKLQNIADNAYGKCRSISSISEIEQLLVEFLADVCDLNYKTVATIPGDGGKHSCDINVSPSVIEANIRIAGGAKNAIANGNISLRDPSGNEIELRNSGNVRFDKDATAASIKIIMPKPGKWVLSVSDIVGDDIHVGLLEHFKINLKSTLTFPEGNPEGVAYANDVIGIKTWLSYNGNDITDDAIYDAVTSATAVCVSRANPDDKKTVTLTREGNSFVGSFTIPSDCFYDITVRLDWDTVYREDTLTIGSSNRPLYLVGNIENAKVNKGKTITINDIYQYVKDDENDPITAEVYGIMNPDAADVTVNGDSIEITGRKMTSTMVTIAFSDQQGNSVFSDFKVTIIDPLVYVVLGLIILLIAAAAIAIITALKKATDRLGGYMRVDSVSDGFLRRDKSFEAVEQVFGYIDSSESMGLGDNPFGSTGSDPFGSTGNNPLGSTGSDPFGSTGSNPFASTGSDPFASTGSDPFASTGSDPFASTGSDPFASTGSDPFASTGSDPFASTGTSETDFYPSYDNSEEAHLHGKKVKRYNDVDIERNNKFKTYIAVSSTSKNRKKSNLSLVVKRFFSEYESAMTIGGHNSELCSDVLEYVNSHFGDLSGIKLFGTFAGKFGVIVKTEKSAFKKIVFHSPSLGVKKYALNPSKRSIKIIISIPSGDVDENGNIPCSHIEITYSKKQ